MRTFSSYGPIDKDLNYFVPRQALIEKTCAHLTGGHYITVWAPRQRGKTWILIQVLWRLQDDERFQVCKINLERLKMQKDPELVILAIAGQLQRNLNMDTPIQNSDDFHTLFLHENLKKPLILIMDEFDALHEEVINGITGTFRNIYIDRQEDQNPSHQKKYLLHGLALIGVRHVLGIENTKGSPFNVQRSLHIPNLCFKETQAMYRWYEQESGQTVKQEVIDRIFYETRGQPGLVSWLGELLTETYLNQQVLDMEYFNQVFNLAVNALPNNNILNIISKARQKIYRTKILEIFKTKSKVGFTFDDSVLNFLYTNGVIDYENQDGTLMVKFPSPFVQKRLFNYFARDLFQDMGEVFTPFEDTPEVFADDKLNIKNLIRLYEKYLLKNQAWLLKDAPRRKDLRVFEAIFHFNLYQYLNKYLSTHARIWPEFPTGNGKVDLMIQYEDQSYALELKSFTNDKNHQTALTQAAAYAGSLGLDLIYLVVFVESIPDQYRIKYEVDFTDQKTGVKVTPIFVATGIN